MTTPSITPIRAFGLKHDVKDNVWFSDDNILLYPVGNNIVIYDAVKKTQKFFNDGTNSSGGEALPGISFGVFVKKTRLEE